MARAVHDERHVDSVDEVSLKLDEQIVVEECVREFTMTEETRRPLTRPMQTSEVLQCNRLKGKFQRHNNAIDYEAGFQ